MAKAKSKAKSKASGRMIICRIERCLGCRSCEIACALAHAASDDIYDAVLEQPRPQRRVRVEPVAKDDSTGRAGAGACPMQCQHCEDAPCLEACPSGALRRAAENGPVLVDADRCIGCKFCVMACPFGAIEMSRDGRAVVKCDLCIERTQAGKEPACVSACPTGALALVDIEEYNRRKRRAAAKMLQAAQQTGEP